MVPKEVAGTLLKKQELDLTPEFSNTVPKVKAPCMNNSTIAKLAFEMFSSSPENLGIASEISFLGIKQHHEHDLLHSCHQPHKVP